MKFNLVNDRLKLMRISAYKRWEVICMNFCCEGKNIHLSEGATPQDLWNLVRNGRKKENAVLASLDGDIIDFNTPFPREGNVTWLPINSPEAFRAYCRTAVFLLVCACREIYGEEGKIAVKHSLGNALYCEFKDGHTPLQKELSVVLDRMKQIVAEKRDIKKISVGKKRALAYLRMTERWEDADFLMQLDTDELDVDQCGSVVDYYLGPLLPDMGFIRYIDLHSYAPGFLLRMAPLEKDEKGEAEEAPLFAGVFLESERWSELIGCHNLLSLNNAIASGEIYDYVAVAEALQEKRIAELADYVCSHMPKIRLVCIAGPSSSGKTTFVKRLIIHLRVNGSKPVMLSLDDFFHRRADMKGKDWEGIDALDISLFEETVSALLEGKKVRLPRFDFITGEQVWDTEPVQLGENQPILIEGLHALNPALTYFVPGYQCVRVYLSALTQITINDHNRISTSDTRLLRRLVRDAQFRGSGAEHTLKVWESVRQGEEKNIFHFQNRADAVFNSALLYEIPVLKNFAVPLLQGVKRGSPVYSDAQRLLHFLRPFRTVSPTLVPEYSLLREFIGYRGVGKSFLNH